MKYKFNLLFVTFFYIGKIKYAPGTFASLATTISLFILINILNIKINLILILLIIILFYSFFAINYLKDQWHILSQDRESFEKIAGTLSENHDPREVVIDELIGQSIPIMLYEFFGTIFSNHFSNQPNEASLKTEMILYLGFFLVFRYFDIFKPFPINFIDREFFKYSRFMTILGIILDDIVAGIYSFITFIIVIIIYNFMNGYL